MNSENEVGGWTENYWNGITTLQWTKICYDMLVSWDSYEIVNIPATECISKYQLLNLIKKVFNKCSKRIIHLLFINGFRCQPLNKIFDRNGYIS